MKKIVQVQVRPECGRLVSFSAGKECLHGVKPVTRGRRCAMALWFTLDPAYDESVSKRILFYLLYRPQLTIDLCCSLARKPRSSLIVCLGTNSNVVSVSRFVCDSIKIIVTYTRSQSCLAIMLENLRYFSSHRASRMSDACFVMLQSDINPSYSCCDGLMSLCNGPTAGLVN